jgi:hypothetical protein
MFRRRFEQGDVVKVTVDLRPGRFSAPVVLAETRGIVQQPSGFMKDPIVEFSNGRVMVVPVRHLEHERVGILERVFG